MKQVFSFPSHTVSFNSSHHLKRKGIHYPSSIWMVLLPRQINFLYDTKGTDWCWTTWLRVMWLYWVPGPLEVHADQTAHLSSSWTAASSHCSAKWLWKAASHCLWRPSGLCCCWAACMASLYQSAEQGESKARTNLKCCILSLEMEWEKWVCPGSNISMTTQQELSHFDFVPFVDITMMCGSGLEWQCTNSSFVHISRLSGIFSHDPRTLLAQIYNESGQDHCDRGLCPSWEPDILWERNLFIYRRAGKLRNITVWELLYNYGYKYG